MQIRYVVSTMVFWWRETHLSFEQECEYLRDLGFGIELWPSIRGTHDCRYVRRNWGRLKNATDGMIVAMNSRTDGPTMAEWTEQIECAQMLGAPIIVDMEALCVSDELGIADWAFAKDVVDLARSHDVKLCLETGALSALMQVAERLDYVSFCLDTGYMHISKKASFKEYVDKLIEKTTYLHLTDNYGVLDDHQPPGLDGGMPRENWSYLLEGLKRYDKDVIASLEMFPSMPGVLIRKSSEFLFDKLGWPGKPEAKVPYNAYRPL